MQKLTEIASRRELFVNLTLGELRSKYKRSLLGWTWSLLNPLSSLLIYSLDFCCFFGVNNRALRLGVKPGGTARDVRRARLTRRSLVDRVTAALLVSPGLRCGCASLSVTPSVGGRRGARPEPLGRQSGTTRKPIA
jgi:hypothetical protein